MSREPIKIPPFVFSDAVRTFWDVRDTATKKQAATGKQDMGGRGAVTSGKSMAGFTQTIHDLVIKEAGLKKEHIHFDKQLELPGYFRATKKWDLVVIVDDTLLAAIEMKSQVGPSFGNNANNRAEESVGGAVDFWTAYREKAFSPTPSQPFIGYVFLLEDCEGTSKPVKTEEPHFKVFPEFKDASYAKRYELLMRRLVLEKHYTSACLLLADSSKANQKENYTVPAKDDLSPEGFLAELIGKAMARRSELG